jgi:hypothetical protein
MVGNGDGFRIFTITESDTTLVTMNNLTLAGGDAGFSFAGRDGGAISTVNANLTVRNWVITGNAGGSGICAIFGLAV